MPGVGCRSIDRVVYLSFRRGTFQLNSVIQLNTTSHLFCVVNEWCVHFLTYKTQEKNYYLSDIRPAGEGKVEK